MTTLDATTSHAKPCGCPELPEISRRSFLKRAGAAGVVAGLATEGHVHAARLRGRRRTPATCSSCCRCAAAWTACRRSCPTGDPDYANWRPNIEIPQGQLLPHGRIFGMHPSMGSLKPFYDAGRLRRRAGGRHGRAQPFALLGDGGDGARGARLVAAHRLARPRARPASRRRARSRPRSSARTPRRAPSWDRRPSSRCGRSTRSTWTARGTTTRADPLGHGAAGRARGRPGCHRGAGDDGARAPCRPPADPAAMPTTTCRPTAPSIPTPASPTRSVTSRD